MEYKYLILDTKGEPVAHARSEDSLDRPLCRLRIDDGNSGQVLEHEYVKLVGMTDRTVATEGRVRDRHGDVVTVETVRTLGEEVRRNLRIPVRFESFLYPISGNWKGRAPVVSRDLSCGGVAFVCERRLEIGEIAQIVIPVTTQPLLLDLKILRQRPSPEGEPLYASEFLNMLHEQESMVREAVFSLQIHRKRR